MFDTALTSNLARASFGAPLRARPNCDPSGLPQPLGKVIFWFEFFGKN